MLARLWKRPDNMRRVERPKPRLKNIYQPEPPIGFVPRSDPNFFYLSRR